MKKMNVPLPIFEQDIIRIYAYDHVSRLDVIQRIQQNLPFINDPVIVSDVVTVLNRLSAMTDEEFLTLSEFE